MVFMREALAIARQSGEDLPIGAIVVRNGEIISSFHNEKELRKDVTAHAEMLAVQEAQKLLGTTVLSDCELYVTLEPCPMCGWAILNARLKKVFFGAYDNVYGAFGSAINLQKFLNAKTEITGGILEEECQKLLREYFQKLR